MNLVSRATATPGFPDGTLGETACVGPKSFESMSDPGSCGRAEPFIVAIMGNWQLATGISSGFQGLGCRVKRLTANPQRPAALGDFLPCKVFAYRARLLGHGTATSPTRPGLGNNSALMSRY